MKSGINANGVTPQDKRNRIQFRFWLDANKPEQAEMGDKLDRMKADKNKSFAAFIRNAIRLMLSLMAGETIVLVELFPHVVEAIRADATPTAGDSLEAIVRRAIKDEIGQRELTPIEAKPSGGLQQIGGLQKIQPPSFDDNEIELTVSKAKGDGNATQNFLNAMWGLQNKKG